MKPIPYGRQNIDSEDINAVIDVLKSDYITQGPVISEFENEFSKYVGSKFSIAVSSATAGLHLSVLSLNLKKGDRVITSPISFAATANCIRYCGAEVWFADIDPKSYLISLEKTKELIESKPNGFFKGIIPVNFGGLPVNLEEFRNLANKHNLWIIEDAAHSPGGYFIDSNGHKNMSGNGKYSDLSVFSFHPVKHIACGEGGMITTNSKTLYKKLVMLRTHGITKNNMKENHGDWFYEMQLLGFNYRLTDIQSALGITQLRKNNAGLKSRNSIANKYRKAFGNLFKFQNVKANFFNAYHLFIIETERRKDLYDFLKKNNILCQVHYIPIHTLPYYKKIGYDDADLNNSLKYYNKCLSLPLYPALNTKDQNYIIGKIIEFFKK